jgi:aminoglycoside N3'-acetyltransferase
MVKSNIKILNKILGNLKVKKSDNIYLGVDIFKLYKTFNSKKINRFDFVNEVLDFFLKKLGKNGNLIIPVFDFNSVIKKKFDQRYSSSDSGALGALLLKDYYKHRIGTPFYSFLCFGKKLNIYKKIQDPHTVGKNSLWKYFIKDNFYLLTLGHHYSRSFTHVHHLEYLAKVKYRYDKNFKIYCTDMHGNKKTNKIVLYVRNRKLCKYSAITKKCDLILLKNKISQFYKYKKLICFKLNIKKSSKLIIRDLRNKTPKLVSVIKKNKKNNDIISQINVDFIEKKYLNNEINFYKQLSQQ